MRIVFFDILAGAVDGADAAAAAKDGLCTGADAIKGCPWSPKEPETCLFLFKEELVIWGRWEAKVEGAGVERLVAKGGK